MYLYIFAQTLAWIFCLMLFSTKYKPNNPIFDQKPQSTPKYLLFCLVVGFFGALSSVAGHELVHYRHWCHKLVGNIPYTQFFYSHFWQEHTSGHHKHVATEKDPVSHDIGVSSYLAIFKAFVGTHVSSWDRENERIRKNIVKG